MRSCWGVTSITANESLGPPISQLWRVASSVASEGLDPPTSQLRGVPSSVANEGLDPPTSQLRGVPSSVAIYSEGLDPEGFSFGCHWPLHSQTAQLSVDCSSAVQHMHTCISNTPFRVNCTLARVKSSPCYNLPSNVSGLNLSFSAHHCKLFSSAQFSLTPEWQKISAGEVKQFLCGCPSVCLSVCVCVCLSAKISLSRLATYKAFKHVILNAKQCL